jgi:predicted MFS family arabinose efflux permease
MSVGVLTGLIILPLLQGRFGRKPRVVFGSMFMLHDVALQSGSINFSMFVDARYILGLTQSIHARMWTLCVRRETENDS